MKQNGWYLERYSRIFINSKSDFIQSQVPKAVVEWISLRLGWIVKMKNEAHLVEQHEHASDWQVDRVHRSDVYFFITNKRLYVNGLCLLQLSQDGKQNVFFKIKNNIKMH